MNETFLGGKRKAGKGRVPSDARKAAGGGYRSGGRLAPPGGFEVQQGFELAVVGQRLPA